MFPNNKKNRMKKIKFIAVFLIITSITFAQKIQEKKGKILFDKVEIANIDDSIRDQYVFSTLSGEKKLIVNYKSLTADKTTFYQWLEISSPDGKQKTEIPYEVLVTSFDAKRITAHLLFVKYNVFDLKGINDKAIVDLFATTRESLSDKYGKIVASAQIDAEEQKKKLQDIRSRYNPQIQNDKSITFYINRKLTIVGRLNANPYIVGNGSATYAYVIDLDGIQVASLTSTSDFNKYKIETYNGNNYDFVSKSVYSHTNTTFLNEFICDLVSRGYMLGHQAKTEQNKLLQAKVDLAKERSTNVYKKPGYLVDEDGKKYDGIISINFQMLDINQTGQVLPEETADKFGKTVSIVYKNEKNQERTKSFKANSGAYFCVKENGTETFYYGMGVKGEAMKKLQNISNFSFDNSYFYKLLVKEDKIMLLQDPVETEKYVIKIATDSKGQMIDKRETENLSASLSGYLKACKNLANDIKSNQFDLKIEDNLKTIVAEYQNCK